MKKLLFVTLTLLALSFSLPQPAYAQDAPDMKVESPLTTELRASMREQIKQLKPLMESGILGMKADATLVVRDPSGVPIAERSKLTALIVANTRDKTALYREIARLNGHPEWETQIAETNARRLLARIPAGWWYQDDKGNWVQKQAAN